MRINNFLCDFNTKNQFIMLRNGRNRIKIDRNSLKIYVNILTNLEVKIICTIYKAKILRRFQLDINIGVLMEAWQKIRYKMEAYGSRVDNKTLTLRVILEKHKVVLDPYNPKERLFIQKVTIQVLKQNFIKQKQNLAQISKSKTNINFLIRDLIITARN